MELFCDNSERLLAVNYFPKKVLSQMFDMVLNTHGPNNIYDGAF